MINKLKNIDLEVLHDLEKYGAPFWEMPDIDDDPFFGPSSDTADGKQMLFISGPSRNGNHLLHSLLDGHPEICSVPGEDSFLAAFFHELRKNPGKAKAQLQAEPNIDYILSLTGWGINKWKKLWELASGRGGKEGNWSGTQPMGKGYVTDYQDTVVAIDYPEYYNNLLAHAASIRNAEKFMDIIWIYLTCMRLLNPQWKEKKIGYSLVGSGMRAEMRFALEQDSRTLCVAPIRPFETFYYSFAKGRMQTTEVRQDVLKEAWEHWFHKTLDYLYLKRIFPDRVCIVNFNHMIEETTQTAEQICRFLGVGMSEFCLIPTTLGQLTKGNSSFPKDEKMRGVFYSSGMKRTLAPEHWPDIYPALWEKVEKIAI